MDITYNQLGEYIRVPATPNGLRHLLDDLGIEVKRMEDVPDNGGQADTRYVLELLANRGDHACYLGIARELSYRLKHEPVVPEMAEFAAGGQTSAGQGAVFQAWLGSTMDAQAPAAIPFEVQTPLCTRYLGGLFEKVTLAASPKEISYPLLQTGVNPRNNVIDITNFVNLEFGQPLHAFDADKIAGRVIIREAIESESFTPLGLPELKLAAGMVVISDEEKVIALAGVIGGEISKIDETTTRVFLESALFDAISVRLTARKLGIATDSSFRFERGGDFSAVLQGFQRATHLLGELAGAKMVGPAMDFQRVLPEMVIPVSVEGLGRSLGKAISSGQAGEILTSLGFGCDTSANGDELRVLVPTHRRFDVEVAADIEEEIAKQLSYNSFERTVPPVHPQGSLLTTEEVLAPKPRRFSSPTGFTK